jgi:hypothetical protein
MAHDAEAGVFGKIHPVEITGRVDINPDASVYARTQAAEYGSFSSYVLVGTEAAPIAICGRDQYRSRVLVLVQVAGAGGFVSIGDIKQFSSGRGTAGRLFNNAAVEIKAQQQYYILPDGTNAATVTVLIERYDAYPDEPIIHTAVD